MDLFPSFSDLTKPNDLLKLKQILTEIAGDLDTLYTTTAPNGAISARQGRIALYKNGANYERWINIDGATTWQRLQDYDANLVSIASPAQGDIIYYNGSAWAKLAAGTAGKVLRTEGASANPTFGYPADLTIASQAQGDILYYSGSAWVRLAAGTSGKFLKTQGASANPLWDSVPLGGNVVSVFNGYSSGDYSGAGTEGSLYGPGGNTNFRYGWANSGNGSPTTFYTQDWLKTSAVNTIKGKVYVIAHASYDATIQVNIGGQTDSKSVSAGQSTLTAEFSVDVSGLTNGTWYTFSLIGDHASSGGDIVSSYVKNWSFYGL